jgi:hypothetical protein
MSAVPKRRCGRIGASRTKLRCAALRTHCGATDAAACNCRWSDAAGGASLQAALRCNQCRLSVGSTLGVLWGVATDCAGMQEATLRSNRTSSVAVAAARRCAPVRAAAVASLEASHPRRERSRKPKSKKAKPDGGACVRLLVCVCVCLDVCVCVCLDVCACVRAYRVSARIRACVR